MVGDGPWASSKVSKATKGQSSLTPIVFLIAAILTLIGSAWKKQGLLSLKFMGRWYLIIYWPMNLLLKFLLN